MPQQPVDPYSLQRVLRSVGKTVNQDALTIAEMLDKCGQIVLNKSQELVPVKTGRLKSTGKKTVTGRGFGAQCVVSYGGVAFDGTFVDYELPVHENLEKAHAAPTGAKFLANAVLLSRGTMTAMVNRIARGREVRVENPT